MFVNLLEHDTLLYPLPPIPRRRKNHSYWDMRSQSKRAWKKAYDGWKAAEAAKDAGMAAVRKTEVQTYGWQLPSLFDILSFFFLLFFHCSSCERYWERRRNDSMVTVFGLC